MLFYLSKPSETQLCATRVQGFMKNMHGRDKGSARKTCLTMLVLSEPALQGKLVLRNDRSSQRGREKETKWMAFTEGKQIPGLCEGLLTASVDAALFFPGTGSCWDPMWSLLL